MDLITQFPLGDDLAVTLLVLGLLAVAALVAGAVVPTRLRRDEDSAEVDPTLGRRLGAMERVGQVLRNRKGELLVVDPSTGDIRPGKTRDYPKVAPFDSEKSYREAVKEAGGEVPSNGLRAA